MEKVLVDRALLNVKEFCDYMNIGETKARELLKSKNSNYTIKIGRKIFAHKQLLDEHLIKQAKYKL